MLTVKKEKKRKENEKRKGKRKENEKRKEKKNTQVRSLFPKRQFNADQQPTF